MLIDHGKHHKKLKKNEKIGKERCLLLNKKIILNIQKIIQIDTINRKGVLIGINQ